MKKIKVVKQHDIKDCGACSLLSIILYYGGVISLEKVRLDTFTGKEGTSALNIINASKKYGFDSVGIKVDNLYDDSIKLPAIAHVTTKRGLDHFVVVYKLTSKNVYIMDPAKGKIIMTIEDFQTIWNNILLLFYPKQKIIFVPKENSLFNLFFKIFYQEKKTFLNILVVSILFTIFTILSSYYFKIGIDSIANNKDFAYLKIVILVFSCFLFFKLIFNNIRKRLENHLNKNIDVLLMSNFLQHLFGLPLEVIASRSSGEIMTRIRELTNIKSLFTEIILSCILDLLLMITSIPILYNINNNLFLVLLFMIIIYFAFGFITSKLMYKLVYRNIDLESEFNTVLIENINLIHSIKNLHQTENILRKIEKSLARYLYDNFRFTNFINSEGNIKIWIYELGLFCINTLGIYLIYKQKLTITELITFNTLVVYFLDPIKNVINSLPRYNYLKASFSKINDFLEMKSEELGKEDKFSKANIVVSNLTFSYNDYNQIIKNLNFKINIGEFVLLKGSSGCGKSTICKILEKYIDDYQGNISIGNINIKDISITTLRKNMTFVSQNESLFTGTIKDNIMLDRNIDLDEFSKICTICKIDEIVEKKPLRYETIINDESNYISGGERQRIILARALLQNASIYLIDEALSEVDQNMEKEIILNLQKYLKNKTVIYITHKNQDQLFKNIIDLEENYGL